jgi:HAUS augmin-like complex subunit 3
MCFYLQLFFCFLACREAKLAYRAEVFELQKQIARQQAQFDLLAGQASSLIQGRRARVSAMSTVSVQLISLDEILSSRNLEVFLLYCVSKDFHS